MTDALHRNAHSSVAAEPDAERGSAIVEFIFTSTLVLIPMVYLVLAAGQLQGASYAAVGAADHAAKVFAVSAEVGQAHANAHDAVSRTMSDFGIGSEQVNTEVSCQDACLLPGSTVTVTVSVQVALPWMPNAFDASLFSVDSSATQRVDRFG